MVKNKKTENKVYFITRGIHLKAIQEKGLTIKMGDNTPIIAHPTLASESILDLPKCDIIILAVKSYDLDQAVEDVKKNMKDTTIILPLLNGVDIYERIRKSLKIGYVLPACVYIGTHIESPGIIFQRGGNGKILFGKDPNHKDFYPNDLIKLFDESNIDYEWSENAYAAIWTKYIFISPFGLLTAYYQKTIGEIVNNPTNLEEVKVLINEVVQIARRKGIDLPEQIIELTIEKAKEFPFETKTSFQRDVESKGKKHEGDLFGGTLIKLGKKLGIPTPKTEQIYSKFLL
ncbi:MAG: ketopantoate reductase family protein [Candidatus Odinarchaeota archaeon]